MRVQDLGGGLAQPDPAQLVGDRGFLDAVAAVTPFLDRHGVGGGEGGISGIGRGGECFAELIDFLQLFPGVGFGLADGLEELAIGAVPAARAPVSAVARVVAGASFRVERPGGCGQAGDRGRVHARGLRAGQDRSDRLGQLAGVIEHLGPGEELLLVSGHDPAFGYGTSCRRGRARRARIVRNRSAPLP
jgi:hypothetical protein